MYWASGAQRGHGGREASTQEVEAEQEFQIQGYKQVDEPQLRLEELDRESIIS